MKFNSKDLKQSDSIIKIFKIQEHEFNNSKKNGIKVHISFSKGHGYTAYVNLVYEKVDEKNRYSTISEMPFESIMFNLISAERRSKKALFNAIENFNNKAEFISGTINKKYNLNLSPKEIIIEEL